MSICALFLRPVRLVERADAQRRAFVTAMKHLVKANILAMRAILKCVRTPCSSRANRPNISTPSRPAAIGPAETMNARRFLSLDLNYGRRVDSDHVRVPARQRHDARGVPLLPE
jgi:hypothetical protein